MKQTGKTRTASYYSHFRDNQYFILQLAELYTEINISVRNGNAFRLHVHSTAESHTPALFSSVQNV